MPKPVWSQGLQSKITRFVRRYTTQARAADDLSVLLEEAYREGYENGIEDAATIDDLPPRSVRSGSTPTEKHSSAAEIHFDMKSNQ